MDCSGPTNNKVLVVEPRSYTSLAKEGGLSVGSFGEEATGCLEGPVLVVVEVDWEHWELAGESGAQCRAHDPPPRHRKSLPLRQTGTRKR